MVPFGFECAGLFGNMLGKSDRDKARFAGRSVNIDDSSTSFFVNSRTLMGCTDPLKRGVGAPHQCPLESVASYLIHADVFANSILMTSSHSKVERC